MSKPEGSATTEGSDSTASATGAGAVPASGNRMDMGDFSMRRLHPLLQSQLRELRARVTDHPSQLRTLEDLPPLLEALGRGYALPSDQARRGPGRMAATRVLDLSAIGVVHRDRIQGYIEKLRRGEVILSLDAERGVRPARVLGVSTHDDRPLLEVVLDDGTRLEATPEHVFMAGDRREPRPASTLEPGDLLTVRSKDRLALHRITSIEATRRATVYELRVSAPDTYVANRILVHNY